MVVILTACVPAFFTGVLSAAQWMRRAIQGKRDVTTPTIELDNEPTLLRAAAARHAYIGVLFSCRWRCAPLHALRLLVHLCSLFIFALGGFAYFAGAAESEAVDAPTIAVVLSAVISTFVAIPFDLLVVKLLYHSTEHEQPIAADTPDRSIGEDAPQATDESVQQATGWRDNATEVRWDSLGDDFKNSAMMFVAGGVDQGDRDLGDDESAAQQLVGRVVVLDHLMSDVEAAEAEAWAEGDDIEVVVEDDSDPVDVTVAGHEDGSSESLRKKHGTAPSQEGSRSTNAVLEYGGASMAALQQAACVRVVETPYRTPTLFTLVAVLAIGTAGLFMLTLHLESNNRASAACGQSGASASAPLLFVVLMVDVLIQCVVVAASHGFFLVTNDDELLTEMELDEEERARYGVDMEIGVVGESTAHVGVARGAARCWNTTRHHLALHPIPGQQSLVLRR